MPLKPTAPLLVFDTSAAHIAIALHLADGAVLCHTESKAKGQAEALFPALENLLRKGSITWKDLSALAVGVGPGNYTGIRIGISAARGLALALNIPAVGVTGFAAAAEHSAQLGPFYVAICGPKGHFYVQEYMAGQALGDGALMKEAVLKETVSRPVIYGADMALKDYICAMGRAALSKLQTNGNAPPKPCYIKPPNAAPMISKGLS